MSDGREVEADLRRLYHHILAGGKLNPTVDADRVSQGIAEIERLRGSGDAIELLAEKFGRRPTAHEQCTSVVDLVSKLEVNRDVLQASVDRLTTLSNERLQEIAMLRSGRDELKADGR